MRFGFLRTESYSNKKTTDNIYNFNNVWPCFPDLSHAKRISTLRSTASDPFPMDRPQTKKEISFSPLRLMSFAFFLIVSNPLLSLICMSAERKREEHSRLRRTRRDGQADDGIGGARRTQLTARLVWHFTWSLRSLSLSVQCSSSSSCFNS